MIVQFQIFIAAMKMMQKYIAPLSIGAEQIIASQIWFQLTSKRVRYLNCNMWEILGKPQTNSFYHCNSLDSNIHFKFAQRGNLKEDEVLFSSEMQSLHIGFPFHLIISDVMLE